VLATLLVVAGAKSTVAAPAAAGGAGAEATAALQDGANTTATPKATPPADETNIKNTNGMNASDGPTFGAVVSSFI